MNCKDQELKGKLYSNRACANLSFCNSLSDEIVVIICNSLLQFVIKVFLVDPV